MSDMNGTPDWRVAAKQRAAEDMYEALTWCVNHLEYIAKRDYPDYSEEMRRFSSVRAGMHALAKADAKPTQSPAPNQPASPREP